MSAAAQPSAPALQAPTSFYNTKVITGSFASVTIVSAATNTKGILIASATLFEYDDTTSNKTEAVAQIGPILIAAGKDLIWKQTDTTVIGPQSAAQTLCSGTDVITGSGGVNPNFTLDGRQLVMAYKVL